MMKRKAGILLPISSLPSRYGIGCFDEAAYKFVDWLQAAGQHYWQILPLVPTSYGDSPYQSFSTFAGNPYFISLDKLVEAGLLTEKEIKAVDMGKKLMILTMPSCTKAVTSFCARPMRRATSVRSRISSSI